MKRNSAKYLCLTAVTAIILTSCGGEKTTNGGKIEDTTTVTEVKDTGRIQTTKEIIYGVPSPAEVAQLLKDAGATYNIKIMNDQNNADKYSTLKMQALNLGVYGADLNYANVFEKNTEVQFYMESCQNLVKKLGIESAINDEVWDRLEENKDNRDSLNSIISEVYLDLDTYLEENGKVEISGLIVVGGWIEGLYLATEMVNEKKPNTKMMERVAEQKLTLDNLMKLIDSYGESDNIKSVKEDLMKLKALYDKVNVTKQQTTSSTDANGMTTIGGGPKFEMPMELFKEIKTTTKQIRESIVKV